MDQTVQDLLVNWGYSHYISDFKDQGIDIEAFDGLNNDFIKELTPSLGDRIKITKHFSTYKQPDPVVLNISNTSNLNDVILDTVGETVFSSPCTSTITAASEISSASSFMSDFIEDRPLDVRALRDMHIKVPEAVRVGDSVTLTCDYDLESVALYTIKWYRFEEEFYRFVPKESPPSKVFAMPHITVDVSKSNSREVTLTGVERETSGEYRCEVSADAPLFHTDIRAANLLVATIPEESPILRTEVQKVAPGAEIRANCTTPGSYPSMNISWSINDKQISEKYKYDIQNSIIRYEALDGLETVRSAISIREDPDLFKNGKMKLKCTATMFSLYKDEKEVEIQEDAPRLALIMEPTPHTNNGVCILSNRYLIYCPLVVLIFFVHLHTWLRRLVSN